MNLMRDQSEGMFIPGRRDDTYEQSTDGYY